MTLRWRTAWITGASTGIGRELALVLARQGVRVAVSARSANKLRELSQSQQNILAVPLDVTDPVAVAAAFTAITAEFGGIDLAVLNAGIWTPMPAKAYKAESAVRSMAINYAGIAHALEPLLADMLQRRSGHVALVASMAGYRGLHQAAAYAPSKAAVISLAEVLRLELAGSGVDVSVINPGFVDTPMTAVNTFPMPFKITAVDAAHRIVKGLDRRRFEVAFPWQLAALLKIARTLPYGLYFPLAKFSAPRRNGKS